MATGQQKGRKLMRGPIVHWDCPRNCGYFREWHASPEYLYEVVNHPFYGPILAEELVAYDITTHSCGLARLAHSKARAARMAREEVPEVYPAHGNAIYSPDAPREGLGRIRARARKGERHSSAVPPVFPDSAVC